MILCNFLLNLQFFCLLGHKNKIIFKIYFWKSFEKRPSIFSESSSFSLISYNNPHYQDYPVKQIHLESSIFPLVQLSSCLLYSRTHTIQHTSIQYTTYNIQQYNIYLLTYSIRELILYTEYNKQHKYNMNISTTYHISTTLT